MATIPPTTLPYYRTQQVLSTDASLAKIVLGASDTFAYLKGTNQILILRNHTAGSISPLIKGDNIPFPSDGAGARSTALGYAAFAIAAGVIKVIRLDTIEAFLQGTITITLGAGLTASLINPIP